MAEGQQAFVPIQSLPMQINADAVYLVRTQFQQTTFFKLFRPTMLSRPLPRRDQRSTRRAAVCNGRPGVKHLYSRVPLTSSTGSVRPFRTSLRSRALYPVEHGLIATMDFPTELRLLDLNGDVAFKMGIYELLSSSDHLWCQWFAYQLQAEGLFDGSGGAFDGLLYPSRKNRGKEALALASTYVDEARPGIIHTEQPFKDTPEYRQLLADPLRIAKP